MPVISTTRQNLRRQFISISSSFVLSCLLVGPAGLALSQTADERVWQEFLQWVSTIPPADRPAPIFEQYRARLLAEGISPTDANHQMTVIGQMLRTRTDGWRVMFNNIYSSQAPGFNTNPNALLVSAIEGRTPGRALDVGMGQGRNAVFLAIKGWDVTGFDVSDEGLRIAQRNAERAGVKLNAVLQSDEQFDFGTARWDLSVITYEPVPLTTASYVKKLSDALRDGGLVVIESFASESGAFNRRSVDIDPRELRRAFGSFRILHFEDTFAMPDWGKERTRLARLIAERKE
jgi:SAM-dependent methyltransferase